LKGKGPFWGLLKCAGTKPITSKEFRISKNIECN
jgi:hypothetical protein